MKKVILLLTFLFLCQQAFSDTSGGNVFDAPSKIPVLTHVQDNSTGLYVTNYVSTEKINPSTCKILGFEVIAAGTSGEFVAAIHDTASSVSDNTLLGEIEAVQENFAGMFFPYPRWIANQLCIRQGGHTRVIIYYTRY